jgi:hypothetical protein
MVISCGYAVVFHMFWFGWNIIIPFCAVMKGDGLAFIIPGTPAA